jgi:hypothetical protein
MSVAGRGGARHGSAIDRGRVLRLGDWTRGAHISIRARRLIIEWWSPNNGRYRVWKLGPLELHREIPF